jgi:tRNA U34 5-carboxymethylaminomethyl modifying enzyme MnmG/GidA
VLARCDSTPCAVRIRKAEHIRSDVERELTLLPSSKMDALKVLELALGAGGGGNGILQVELDDFGSVAGRGVAQTGVQAQALPRAQGIRREAEVAQFKAAVAEAEAGWIAGRSEDILVAAVAVEEADGFADAFAVVVAGGPVVRGMLIGSLADGLAAPVRMRAMAVPTSVPRLPAWSSARAWRSAAGIGR